MPKALPKKYNIEEKSEYMSELSRKSLILKLARNTISIITILGLIFTIYFGFFYERKPDISFTIISESNVLDVYKPLEELEIYFQGEDIQRNNLNLRIITISIKNEGKANITQNLYDNKSVWGFHLKDGKIIEARIVGSNSGYLLKNLDPQVIALDSVQFTKVILERDKFFNLEILTLHDKKLSPEIIPIGKIAGIDTIIVRRSHTGGEKLTFLGQLLHGNMLIHLIRFIIYILLLIITFSLVVTFIETITQLYRKMSFRKKVKFLMKLPQFQNTVSENYQNILQEIILPHYVKYGIGGLLALQRWFKGVKLPSPDRDIYALRRMPVRHTSGHSIREHEIAHNLRNIISELEKQGVLTGSGENVKVHSEFEKFFDSLVTLLKRKSYHDIASV